jgi:RimJ/RimL family protein N-acetyltransferase
MRNVIFTERLTIEPLALRHARELFDALNDELVGRFLDGPDVTTLEALEQKIIRVTSEAPPERNEEWRNFAVLLNGRVIGRLEATLHRSVAEVAYVFGPAWWGHGYATEATAWLLRYIREAGMSEAWATIAPANTASDRLLARLGFAPGNPPDCVSCDNDDVALVRILA